MSSVLAPFVSMKVKTKYPADGFISKELCLSKVVLSPIMTDTKLLALEEQPTKK